MSAPSHSDSRSRQGRARQAQGDGRRDVFISYSSEDKSTADAICVALEGDSLTCWIAPRDVLPGFNYAEAIIDGINSSRLLLVVLSSASNASPQVLREVERAVSKEMSIIPFRIDKVVPSKSMEFFLSAPHWLDALTKPLDPHLERLSAVVSAALAPGAQSRPESPSGAARRRASESVPTLDDARGRRSADRRKWAGVCILLVLLAVGGTFALFETDLGKRLFRFDRQMTDSQRILGEWQQQNSSLTMEFFSDGSLQEKRLFDTGNGTYTLLPNGRIELKIEGVLWGQNEMTLRYEISGDELSLTSDGGAGIALRYTRVKE